MTAAKDPLDRYRAKRDFGMTPEPAGDPGVAGSSSWAFVIQKHSASRLHYDLRLELDGVMRSWAVPKGPSFDPKDKRMAIQVEDHPMSYNDFEGTIPARQYGAGTVILWDRGTWQPIGDPHDGLAAGKLVFTLHGQKLAGSWELVRIAKPGDRQIAWILFKKHDEYERSRADYDVISALPDSVISRPLKAAATAATAGTSATMDDHVAMGADVAMEAHESLAIDRLDGAVKADLPIKLEPQLATLSNGIPAKGEWSYEIKFDGYRLMTRIEGGVPRLVTRGGLDWNDKMPELCAELSDLGLQASWLDGEIVVLGANGLPEFNALQNSFNGGSSAAIVYFLFDLPFHDGYDLRQVPLRTRRRLLKSLLDSHPTTQLRFSESFVGDPASILQSARNLKLEGLMIKLASSPYRSARSESWLKVKFRQRQEFVVAGFTDRNGITHAAEISSLILGVYDASRQLVWVGSVGAGWTAKTAADLKTRLLKIEIDKPPFASGTAPEKGSWSTRNAGRERWVKPQLVVEVSYGDWTPNDHIRHARFEGLRIDKPAREVRRETARTPDDVLPIAAPTRSARISHPERVIDPGTGLTKLDLVRYYESVAAWLVPHLQGRPCSLVRGPAGITGELFFQKHADNATMPGIRELDRSLSPDHAPMLEVPSALAVAACAQMNVIEFHTWNAQARVIEKPDRLVFDLDPGDGVAWRQVQEGALLVRAFLQELGLQAWLKTSGGKGLHVVVPIAPRLEWPAVLDFSRHLVQHLARVIPGRFVDKSGAANRIGKIYVDYLRNRRGATTAAAYSARARPGLGVSMPIPWDALDGVKSGAHWTIVTAREHLSFHPDDPWSEYWSCRQTLSKAIKRLGTPAAD